MIRNVFRFFLSISLILAFLSIPASGLAAANSKPDVPAGAPPDGYAVDFVAPAATGAAMNDSGDITGTSYPDPGCGSFCLPTLDTVVWRGTQRIVLPTLAGFSGITVRSINNLGWVVGLAGLPGTITHAVAWKPVGDTYQIIDLGTLPGTTASEAIGIDAQGRVVGWSTTLSFPPDGSPFLWTETGGMVDLSALGFPDEKPLAVSPAGSVASPAYWYFLDDPASVVALPPVPDGFYPPGTYPTSINDFGDQARFLVSTGAQNPLYLFRFHHENTWQQISFTAVSPFSQYGIGSINNAKDVTATILGSGGIAYGPDGLIQSLDALVSPAYQGNVVTLGGPMNSSGQILARIIIGQSSRLVRLTPAQSCTSGCIRISNLTVTARFVQDPQDPGHCSPNNNAYNRARVNLTVTDENGAPLRRVTVSGHILDDYWTNFAVSGTTNNRGLLSFSYTGNCGVGAIAFLVDNATKTGFVFDKTTGILTGYAIPR